MPFEVHSFVKIKKLKKIGEVIEIVKPGLYRVSVGALVTACREAELEAAEKPVSKHADLQPRPLSQVLTEKRTSKELEKLDLHGLTVAEAMRKFEDHLNRAIVAGMDRVDVVHGHGTGRVKQALHDYLAAMKVVKHFEVDSFNPGITRVYL
jgi:DNA mismatch repair protein MutS2